MRIISKIIVWILSLLFVFIVANLSIWTYQVGGISNYTQLLNDKDWSETISKVTIKKPVSIFSIFSVVNLKTPGSTGQQIETPGSSLDVVETGLAQDIINTGDKDIETGDELDPYDPEFEDEFNSFFGGDESGIDIITGESMDLDTKDAETKLKEVQESGHTVGEALIKKFNE